MRKRYIALGCGVLTVVGALWMGAFVLAGWLVMTYGGSIVPTLPTMANLNLPPPAMQIDRDLSPPTVWFAEPRLGVVTDIHRLPSGNPGDAWIVAGDRGAAHLDAEGKLVSFVPFDGIAGVVKVVDREGDGVLEFMNRGNWISPASLFTSDGRPLWSYDGGGTGVDDMAAGDIDGDGALEFAVGLNGGGGVHLLDGDGKMRWRRPDGNVWHVELLDANGDGRLDILHSNAGGELTARDATGQVLWKNPPGIYLSQFSLCAWPTTGGSARLIAPMEGELLLIDATGSPLLRLAAPRCTDDDDACATPVRVAPGGQPYLAAAVEGEEASALHVYEPGRMPALLSATLVSMTVLTEPCRALAPFPRADGGEDLLVGGDGRVWLFSLSALSEAAAALEAPEAPEPDSPG